MSCAGASMTMRWYVVHAYSNFENKVAQAIKDGAFQRGLGDKIEEVFVPMEKVVEVRRNRKVDAERKFFPGYVLVQIATHDEAGIPRMDSESWHLVKETPKVMGFIGGTDSQEMKQVGMAMTLRLVGKAHPERLRILEGSHLFPMERPLETAAAIDDMLHALAPARKPS